jgi:hypothetical protein
MSDRIDCPSAPPGRRTSRIFGVMTGPPEARRVGYLTETVEPTPDLLAMSGAAKPTELFRIAAPCAKSACIHFNGSCTLAQRIVASLAPVVSSMPPCQIRPTCRWYLEQGGGACLRCPQIATEQAGASEEEVRIAGATGTR